MKHYGLIGEKLGHSFSPQIHNIILEKINKTGDYGLIEIPRGQLKEQYEKAINQYDGINVTIPYKKEIMPFVESMDRAAAEIDAVNTIKIKDGHATGYNTDYYGFGYTLDYFNVDIQNKKIVILGTGGASKAIYYYLINNGCGEIIFVNRKKDTHWAKECNIFTYDEIEGLTAELVVNCTPIGMGSLENKSPLSVDDMTGFKTAVDLIYNPKETLFLKQARENGAKAVNGLMMLVAQAVRAQEIWNHITVERKIVEEIYNKIYSMLY